MIGASYKEAIVSVSLVERKSGYTVLAIVTNKTSGIVNHAIVDRLKAMDTQVRTIPYGNGKESSDHRFIDQEIDSTTDFADPLASWQRGLNENLNG